MIGIIYLATITLVSLATFATYGVDKRRARIAGRRVPERTLHLMSVLGGWPGAWVAQRVFRHKTRKLSFQLIFWGCLLLHVLLVGTVVTLFATDV